MCGIVGWADKNEHPPKEIVQKMCDILTHRGPDDNGLYESSDHKIILGHRRLSFLDLTSAGRQPMSDHQNNLHITFNGEIYNYIELKQQLKDSYTFHTDTDTEVLLAAYLKWGIQMLDRLKGMFAFALLDETNRQLFLVRDRFGIKPMYYSLSDTQLIFASEPKAIMASGELKKEIDFTAFIDYFVYRYIPSPKTIWKDVKKLPPAHFLKIDIDSFNFEIQEYWKLKSNKKTNPLLVKEVGEILQKSVREHTRADVEVGSFLSGGYDSSALVSYMKKLGQNPHTFSIGFDGWENSEHQYAQAVAKHISVPNETVMADVDSLELLERMPSVYDEPIADISVIPTYMVSQLAHTKVKAVLSGEGADEIFGGYTWQHSFFNASYPESFLDKLKLNITPIDTVIFYAQAMSMGNFDEKELKEMLHPDYHQFVSDDVHWFYRKHFKEDLTPLKSIQYMDMKCFMGELVLTKIDRASMANSLEVRVPFLDHELFEKIFSTSEKEYFDIKQTKQLLYENIKNDLPAEILHRKKQGFVGPDSYYMNMDWYKMQLADSNLVKHGIIRQEYLDTLLKNTYDWRLWKIVVMEKWFSKWIA